MELSNPLLLSALAFLIAVPIAVWLSRRTADALHQHDAALDRIDFDRVACTIPAFEPTDPLGQIASLAQQEVALIREILDDRITDGHADPAHVQELRQVHRRGLALRQCCGDPALEVEVGWLQRYGSLALLADLSELDRAKFESELTFRAEAVRRTVEQRRRQRAHPHASITAA